MKTTAIAVLTWNRQQSLKTILSGLKHSQSNVIGVFDDASMRDGTQAYIRTLSNCQPKQRKDLDAVELFGQLGNKRLELFLGLTNRGVAGNTNRALRWFIHNTTADYLLLCNDDLIITGPFDKVYANAADALDVGLLCFCGFTSKMYAYDVIEVKVQSGKSYKVKILGRMTGAMMCISRKLVERIGYFSTAFGKFGEEHVEFTTRAKLAGFQNVAGIDRSCIDIVTDGLLNHAEVESTMVGREKAEADEIATKAVKSVNYVNQGLFVPYALSHNERCQGVGDDGIAIKWLPSMPMIGRGIISNSPRS